MCGWTHNKGFRQDDRRKCNGEQASFSLTDVKHGPARVLNIQKAGWFSWRPRVEGLEQEG